MNDAIAACSKVILAIDLDGTLIPLPGNAENAADLVEFSRLVDEHAPILLYATGRNQQSALEAIEMFGLPNPAGLVCDVGAEICEPNGRSSFCRIREYSDSLAEILNGVCVDEVMIALRSIKSLQLRAPEKQSAFKLAYSVPSSLLETVVSEVEIVIRETNFPFSIIHSMCIESGDGYVDVVPAGISKASAVRWWANRLGMAKEQVVYAGDSGNDLAALCEGFRSIVVSNAQRGVAKRVYEVHRSEKWTNRLFLADRPATSGVLDGCRWFELFPGDQGELPMELGAVPISSNRTHFRVWAPKRKSITVERVDRRGRSKPVTQLLYDSDGYFTGIVALAAGEGYQFLLDQETRRPDPTTQFQPNGVHHESQIVHHQFPWTDDAWKGVEKSELVIYELHIGTFTDHGTFLSAIERIPELVDLGVTAIELLPVAQSPGKWNWGYDGVNLFAARNTYGTPDEFRELVDACHGAGLAVLLDVVYNHLGPEGNYLSDFGRYYSRKHRTPWGEAFDFDGRNAKPVRRFIIENVLYWLRDFHLDGLRLDAVHFMFDDGDYTILDEIRERVLEFEQHAGRKIHLIAEANIFDHQLVVGRNTDRESNVAPYCASWCDDIMHSIYSLGVPTGTMTHREYAGAADLAESLHHGFIYTGPTVTRVTETNDLRRKFADDRNYLSSLIVALQTHDSVGNHPQGKRLHHLTSVDFQMAAAALILLYPAIPMIFMGEEYAAESTFPFFVDFEDPGLRERVDRGRAAEYPQHRWNGALSPSDPKAFQQANCHAAALRNNNVAQWYRSLLALRRELQRGGLLRPENLKVDCDLESNYFRLSYQDEHAAPAAAQIHVKLRGHDEPDNPQPVEFSVLGDIVLDSRQNPGKNASSIRLQANHALVTLRRQL